MPRANRYFLPGYVWHITHRCHKKEFLLKFHKDRANWIRWLFEAKKRYGLSVLNYMVTSNHIHLLVHDTGKDVIPKSMQLIAGRVAQAGAASAMPQPRNGPSRVTVCGSSGGIQPAEPGASDHVPCEVRVVSRPRSTQINWARWWWCQSTSRARPCWLSKRKAMTGGPSLRSNQSSASSLSRRLGT